MWKYYQYQCYMMTCKRLSLRRILKNAAPENWFLKVWTLPALLLFGVSGINAQVFYKGVDLSYVNELEDCGTVYHEDGVAADPYELFAGKGANLVRLRLWHNPEWTDYSTFEDVVKSISRAKAAGMEVILDFHYSDTWTDPGAQEIPSAWKDVEDVQTLADSLYEYTYKTLRKLGDRDLMPEFVQLGNEINGNILLGEGEELYPLNWTRNKTLLDKAAEAVDAIESQYLVSIKKILHIAQPENAITWFEQAAQNDIDNYDVIGLSYYPGWSTLSLREAAAHVKQLKNTRNKEVLIVETGYPWTLDAKDDANNVLGQDNLLDEYGATTSQDIQRDFLIELSYLVKENGGLGVVYWEPAWVSSDCSTQWGDGSHYENAALFDFDNTLHRGADFLNYDYTLEPEGLKAREVKFVVQMAAADTSNGVFITGNFTGEPWQFREMEHVQGRIFEFTTSIPGRTQGAYIFYNMESWLNAYRENVPATCALYWDDHRKYVIGNEAQSFEFKWGSCEAVDWSDGEEDDEITSVPHARKNALQVYPNPIFKQLHIAGLKDLDQILLFDAAGKTVDLAADRSANKATVDVSALHKGIYILKIETKAGSIYHKLIKN